MRALDLGQGRGEIGEDAVGAQRGDDEARVAERRRLGPARGAAAAGDVDVGDLALGALAGRAGLGRVGQAAEAEARLELGDVGRPDEGAWVLEPAVHGYCWRGAWDGHGWLIVAGLVRMGNGDEDALMGLRGLARCLSERQVRFLV